MYLVDKPVGMIDQRVQLVKRDIVGTDAPQKIRRQIEIERVKRLGGYSRDAVLLIRTYDEDVTRSRRELFSVEDV